MRNYYLGAGPEVVQVEADPGQHHAQCPGVHIAGVGQPRLRGYRGDAQVQPRLCNSCDSLYDSLVTAYLSSSPSLSQRDGPGAESPELLTLSKELYKGETMTKPIKSYMVSVCLGVHS